MRQKGKGSSEDQAKTLRVISGKHKEGSTVRRGHQGSKASRQQNHPRVFAITSGKGGVGKTNVVANLAYATARLGKKVVVLDADVGLANLDVLLGLMPKHNLGDVLRGEKHLSDIMVEGPGGIRILPASSGVQELSNLSREQRLSLLSELNSLDGHTDVLFIDTGAGISQNVIYFNLIADEIIVIASSEPTSITDAYALMKVLSLRYRERYFKLLVNLAKSIDEAREVYQNLSLVAQRFLNLSIDYLGHVPADVSVAKAVRRQRILMELYPDSEASRCFERLARELDESRPSGKGTGNLRLFWNKLRMNQEMAGEHQILSP